MSANLESVEQAIRETGVPSFIGEGSKAVTTAGTRVQLSTPIDCKEVAITAKAANTGYIYVGGEAVSSLQYLARLVANASVVISIDNLSKLWLDASVSAEGVVFGYVR